MKKKVYFAFGLTGCRAPTLNMKKAGGVSAFLSGILVLGLMMWCSASWAGDVNIPGASFMINKSPLLCRAYLETNLTIEFEAKTRLQQRPGENRCIIFRLVKRPEYQMEQSVGPGKENLVDDILFVQLQLESMGHWPSPLSGTWSEMLFNAIKVFQKNAGFKRPDGIIEKNGLTYGLMAGRHVVILLARLMEEPVKGLHTFSSQYPAASLVSGGVYELDYCPAILNDEDLRYARLDTPEPGRLQPVDVSRNHFLKNSFKRYVFVPLGRICFQNHHTVKQPETSHENIEKPARYFMKGSVGPERANFKPDIKFVQSELKSRGFWPYDVDGSWNLDLFEAIRRFQKHSGFRRPDGIMERNGVTYGLILEK